MEFPTQPGQDIDKRAALQVRRAVPGDLGALIDLENASFASDRLSARQWRHHLRGTRASILVVVSNDRLCAAAVVFLRKGSARARLYSLAVAAALRGHGIGGVLLDACENDARERGCTHLRLEVRSDNAAAQRLYQRRGYRKFASRPGFYEDGATALCYEKIL